MNKIVKLALILFAVSAIVALCLGLVNSVTADRIAAIAGAASNVGIEWRSQFQGVPSAAVTKDGGQIEAISGATITSRAVCNGATAAQNAVKTVG